MNVERADLEGKLKEIQDVVDETKQSAANVAIAAVIGIALLLLVVYLLGRKKGKKGSARIEVFRLG